ncbi:MAG: GlgB N-terminal domain-containing protein, partial [Cyanobium sp.]
MAAPRLDWMVDDAQRLAECRHDHPFSVLGPQPSETSSALVRVWMPEAERVELILGDRALALETPNHPWVFETELDHDPGSGYRVRVLRGGIEHEQHDPWAFRHEWMGELDRHLFAEGNHHHIWELMGAHVVERDGIAGVQFCLWAPNARSVAVLGDFNSWDGRHHPMQSRLGGCWELFIPGIQAGTVYKYEVRAQNGHCYQKSDPYAFQA